MGYMPHSVVERSIQPQVTFALYTANHDRENLFVSGQNRRTLDKTIGYEMKNYLPSCEGSQP